MKRAQAILKIVHQGLPAVCSGMGQRLSALPFLGFGVAVVDRRHIHCKHHMRNTVCGSPHRCILALLDTVGVVHVFIAQELGSDD